MFLDYLFSFLTLRTVLPLIVCCTPLPSVLHYPIVYEHTRSCTMLCAIATIRPRVSGLTLLGGSSFR